MHIIVCEHPQQLIINPLSKPVRNFVGPFVGSGGFINIHDFSIFPFSKQVLVLFLLLNILQDLRVYSYYWTKTILD